ncbi:MAG: AsmA family protein [Rhodospirillaceae bacterium]
MRTLGWIAGGIAGALVLVVGGLVATLLLVDWNRAKDSVADFAGGLIGREVAIGSLDGSLGWTTEVRVRGMTVDNADWADAPHLADIGSLNFAIRLWPLFGGTIELPVVEISDASLDLERDAEGRANWEFDAAGEAAASGVTPDDRSEFPQIGSLRIDGSQVRVRDRTSGIDVAGDISLARGTSTEGRELRLALKGSVGRDPLRIEFSGAGLEILRDEDTPYPLEIAVDSGETRISGRGTVTGLTDGGELRLEVSAEGPDLARLFPELKLPLPNTPPYRLTMDVHRRDTMWRLENIDAVLGETDVAGTASVDMSDEKPRITGELVSRDLYFNDLGALIGLRLTPPGGQEDRDSPARGDAGGEARGDTRRSGLFPNVPLDEERLETANVDLKFVAESIRAEGIPLKSARAHLSLENSRLNISDMDIAVADGRIGGSIVLDARPEVPETSFDLVLRALDLKPFFAGTRFIEEMGGRFSGRIRLAGPGRTLADVMAASSGDVDIGFEEGSLSGLLIEGASLDIVEALALFVGEDARVPIRCGRITLSVKDGTAQTERVVVDTTDSILVAQGSLSFAKEAFRLQIDGHAKDFSLIDLSAPLVMSGPIADPSFSVGGVDPLPFFEMGEQEDIDCAGLMQGIDIPRGTRDD